MTPQEKANQLVDKFDTFDVLGENHNGFTAQQCALVAVDEIINSAPFFSYDDEGNFYRSVIDAKQYWEQVKQEIKNL
jgi:hypothetical protein